MPAFKGHGLSVEVGRFANPIPLKTVDTTGYEGCPGSVIAVYPADTAELERVLVAIRTDKAGLIERGSAQWSTERGRWEYTSQATLPNRGEISLDLLAIATRGQHTTNFRVRAQNKYVIVECSSAGEVHSACITFTGRKRQRNSQVELGQETTLTPMPQTTAAAA